MALFSLRNLFRLPTVEKDLERRIENLKEAHEALERERSFLSAVFDTIEEAIIVCDAEGRISRFNEAARRLHGLPAEPIESEAWAEHYDLFREDGKTPLRMNEIPLFRAFRGEQVHNQEIVVLPKNREPHWMNCNGRTLLDEKGRLLGAMVIMHDITLRRESEERVKDLLKEKELLLRETHHRIKNNMHLVSSMLSLQAEELKTVEGRDILETTAERVHGMMILYDTLYRSKDTRGMQIRDFLIPLVEQITGIFSPICQTQIFVKAEDIFLSRRILSPLGIIINELITNSIKYAFPGMKEPEIRISVMKEGPDINLIYEDNGPGFLPNEGSSGPAGFGLDLIHLLVEQIEGSFQREGSNGARCIIYFPPGIAIDSKKTVDF